MAGNLVITQKHSTTKHAQTIGLLERSHTSIKQALKVETGERRSLWHKYFCIAILNHNTSYHTSTGCEPNRYFHGRFPYNILDLKLRIRPHQLSTPASQFAQDVLHQREMIYQDVSKTAMQAYIKYKVYYNKKANAWKLKETKYVDVLQLKVSHQGSKIPFTEFRWLGLTLLKRCYLATNTRYAKLAPRKRECFNACACVSHTPPTASCHTNHARGMETWSGSEPQTRWFVCQSVGVRVPKANFWRRQ